MAQHFELTKTGDRIDGSKGRQLPSCDLFPKGLENYSINEVDGCIYVFGGSFDASGCWQRSNRMFKFNIGDERWSEVLKNGQWPGGLNCHTGCSLNLSIYFVGGRDEKCQPNLHMWIFDCVTKTFRKLETGLPNLSPYLWRAVIGGTTMFATDGGSILEMDLGTQGPWKKLVDSPKVEFTFVIAFVDRSIHMIEQGGAHHRKYDVNKGEIQQLKPLEGGSFLNGPSNICNGNLLVAFATKDGQGNQANVVLFDSSKEELGWTWITATNDNLMPPAFDYSAATCVGNAGIFILGLPHQFWQIYLTAGSKDLSTNRPQADAGPVAHMFSWNELSNNFKRLLSSSEMSDMKFLVGTERHVVKGHVAIVSSHCPKLAMRIKDVKLKREAEMTSSDHKERCCRLEVELPEIEASTFERVLELIYTGRVDQEPEWKVRSEMQLFNAAGFLGLESLRQQCEENLRKSSNVENLVERLQEASRLSLPFAQQFFVERIIRNEVYSEVVTSPRFCRLSPRLVVEIHQQYGRLHGEEADEDEDDGNLEAPE